LEKEIPEEGKCHCGIFCTPEFAQSLAQEDEIEEVVHEALSWIESRGGKGTFSQRTVDGDELEALD